MQCSSGPRQAQDNLAASALATRWRWARGAFLAVAIAAGATASGAQEMPAKGQACVACHGSAGNSTQPGVPSIAGQPKQFLVSALYQFREGKRKNERMSPMAADLSNADMNALAAYFALQKRSGEAHPLDAQQTDAGRKLTEVNNCIACHARDLKGQQHIPGLTGQSADYLTAQLTAFRAGTRGDLDGVMSSAAQNLSDPDIQVLAQYLASLAP